MSPREPFDGFPTADDVARAIVAACRLTGEDPEAVARGVPGNPGRGKSGLGPGARVLAMDALWTAFPVAGREGLARCVGFRNPRSGGASLSNARKRPGWREDWADDVLGAVVAPAYGERAT